MTKVEVKLMDNEDRITRYVEDHYIDMYVDYNDELSEEQLKEILKGNAWEVRDQIVMDASDYMSSEEIDYYKEEMSRELDIPLDEIEKWFDSMDSFYPGYNLDDHDWNRLVSNSSMYITASLPDVSWNFNCWAYGQPLEYSDVKEALKILGVNPKEFRDVCTGGSQTMGDGKVKGYFPNMPNREPKVNVKDLYEQMIVLYDGCMNFCLSDPLEVSEVMASDSKTVVFKKGTPVVFYDFGNGAGICDIELTEDCEVPRKLVDFDSDKSYRYGIEECYGFGHSYWEQGSVQIGK